MATFYELLRTTDPGHRDDVVHVCVDPVVCPGWKRMICGLRWRPAGPKSTPVHVWGNANGRRRCSFREWGDQIGCRPTMKGISACPKLATLVCGCCVGWAKSIPTSLDSYRQHGGYRALAAGRRDGAGGSHRCGHVGVRPFRPRWGGIPHRDQMAGRGPDEPGPDKHVVANCDESEPGTFKDRIVCERDPFRPNRVDDHCRSGHRIAPRLDLHPRRIPPSHRPPRGCHRPGSGRRIVRR